MHPTNRERKPLLGAALLLSLAVGSAVNGQEQVQPRPATPGLPAPAGTAVQVPIGTSQKIGMTTKKRLINAASSVEGIISILPNNVDPTTVIVTGVASGRTRLTLTDQDRKEETIEIVVQLDVAVLKQLIAEHVPTANVNVGAAVNRMVILSGWVAKAEDVDTILRIAQAFVGQAGNVINAMTVGGVQMVQLDVTVASVSRSEARRRGFNFAYGGNQVSLGSILGGLASPSSQAQGAGAAGGVGVIPAAAGFIPNVGGGNTNFVLGIVPANTQLLFQALREEQLAKILAEPKLLTQSGRPAHSLAGGQQAILSASGGLGGPGVSYREIGTELDFLPIVMGNGRIYVEISAIVRSVNQALGLTTSFGAVPGFNERNVRTAVELETGQTVAISGLIQTTVQASANKVPILGDIPYLGALFSTVTHREDEEELVIMLTPHLVDAQDCRQSPKRLPGRETRSPDDYELFLESLLEAPRGQRQVFENGKYKAPYKNDPSWQRFPCADPLPKETNSRRGGASSDSCPPAVAPATPAPSGLAPMPTPIPGVGLGANDYRVTPPMRIESSAMRRPPAPVIPAPAYEDR